MRSVEVLKIIGSEEMRMSSKFEIRSGQSEVEVAFSRIQIELRDKMTSVSFLCFVDGNIGRRIGFEIIKVNIDGITGELIEVNIDIGVNREIESILNSELSVCSRIDEGFEL